MAVQKMLMAETAFKAGGDGRAIYDLSADRIAYWIPVAQDGQDKGLAVICRPPTSKELWQAIEEGERGTRMDGDVMRPKDQNLASYRRLAVAIYQGVSGVEGEDGSQPGPEECEAFFRGWLDLQERLVQEGVLGAVLDEQEPARASTALRIPNLSLPVVVRMRQKVAGADGRPVEWRGAISLRRPSEAEHQRYRQTRQLEVRRRSGEWMQARDRAAEMAVFRALFAACCGYSLKGREFGSGQDLAAWAEAIPYPHAALALDVAFDRSALRD